MGLVGDNFSRREVMDRLPRHHRGRPCALFHHRRNHPAERPALVRRARGRRFAIGHNGNLTNGLALRRQLVHEGAMMQSTTDTEVILHLVARAKRNRFVDRFIEACASSKAPTPSSA